MSDLKQRAWIEVSLPAIDRNYKALKEYAAPECGVIAVLKADAYGLNAAIIGRHLQNIGCDHFAAASIDEALKLRKAGIRGRILILSPILPKRVKEAVKNELIVPLVSFTQAQKLSLAAKAADLTLECHIAADCGLTRFGVQLDDMPSALHEAVSLLALPSLKITGVYTHFTEASINTGDELNRGQIALFKSFTDELKRRGYDLCVHGASSYMAMAYKESHFDHMRVASFLWGIEPWPGVGPQCELAVSLRCRILQIKNIDAGTPVGYGPAFIAPKSMRIAILPVGYADGLRRSMVGKIDLLINGKRAPMIGKMFMDYTVLDVTDVHAREGDVVTVMGRDGDDIITAADLAAVYPGTVGEVLAVLNKRLPRIYD